MTPPELQPPAPRAGGADRVRHVPGRRWPGCGCRLCMDDFICPAAVTRAGRALVLTAALGAVGALAATVLGAL